MNLRRTRRYDPSFRNASRFWACKCGWKGTKKPEKRLCPSCGVEALHFQSKGEWQRWRELLLLEKAGKISNLRRQVRIALEGKNGPLMHLLSNRRYSLAVDFSYEEGGKAIYEDYKSGGTNRLALDGLSELKYAILKAQLAPNCEIRINGVRV